MTEEVKLNLSKLGKNGKEVLENLSFIIIVVSGTMFSIGIALGSFIQGTIALSIIGAFLIMTGIVLYMTSQFIEG